MVTAKVLGINVGDRDYIWVTIEYDISGTKVVNSYPLDFKNTVGKTDQEIIDWIKTNVRYQMDRYIEAQFRKNNNAVTVANRLQALIGQEMSKDSAILQFDANNDGTVDTQWEVKEDGTYIETSI